MKKITVVVEFDLEVPDNTITQNVSLENVNPETLSFLEYLHPLKNVKVINVTTVDTYDVVPGYP